MLFLVNKLHEKREIEDKKNFFNACTLFVICNCVTNLHSCYMKNALFLANSAHNFLCIIVINKKVLKFLVY